MQGLIAGMNNNHYLFVRQIIHKHPLPDDIPLWGYGNEPDGHGSEQGGRSGKSRVNKKCHFKTSKRHEERKTNGNLLSI